jgi:alpha-mannosidase
VTHKAISVEVIEGTGVVRHQGLYDATPVHPETQVAPYTLVFSTELAPLSSTRFLVKQNNARGTGAGLVSRLDGPVADNTITLENDFVRAIIDIQTGSITKLTNKKKSIDLPISLDVAFYQSYRVDGQVSSGAYIFRPDSNKTYSVVRTSESGQQDSPVTMLKLSTDRSAVSSIAAFKVGDWVTVEYRLGDGDEFLEIEWTVGPIPIVDNIGKEVIVRFDTGGHIKSASTLYTDSNGMEFLKRVRNHRDTWNLTLHDDQETVAANYFPITTGAYIKDSEHQLNVVTDRAQGAASLKDGQIEIMVHRRVLGDDSKGVGEHLNETESVFDSTTKQYVTKGLTVRGNFFINVDTAQDGMKSLRSKMEKQFFQPLVALRKPVAISKEAKLPWLTVNEFPPNVGLTTLTELTKQCLLVRLTHLYSVEEHAELSTPVSVDFAKLFTTKNGGVTAVKELSLTGVKELSSEQSSGLEWKTEEGEEEGSNFCERSIPVFGTTAILQPMEVRTFRVCFGSSNGVADELVKAVEMPELVDVAGYRDEDEHTAVEATMEEMMAVE